MSQLGSQPTTAGPATGPASLSQPLPPPPRTSSREASSNGDGRPVGIAETATGQQESAAGQTAASTTQPSELYGSPGNEKTEHVGRGSKRSLTNLRGRDRSTASKRSNQQQNNANEKEAGPASSGGTATNNQSRSKKRTGFMSIFNCCAAPDEAGQSETAQPAKTLTKTPPTRAQQPTQTKQQQQSTAQFDPSADESKEVVMNEKTEQPPYAPVIAAPAMLPSHETDKPPQGDASAEKLMPDLPPEAPQMQQNTEVRPLQAEQQAPVPEAPVTGSPHVDNTTTAREEPQMNEKPQSSLQTPTPVVAQSEDEMILDRTPEQAARDQDIEMSDAGPSLPLSGQEAAVVVEEERQAHAQRESSNAQQADLPPPPPPQDREEAAAQDGAATSQLTSIASTPEPPPPQKWLLPPLSAELQGRKCLVLDLDETLVHSSFKLLHQADFTIPVEIDGTYHNVYVIKRPGADAFLKRVGELYEVVVFTASVSKYGDPVLDNLDIHRVVHHRLFRESCYNHQGNYVKDLSQLGRELRETIIIDNSPTSYIFHPQHAVPVSSWFSDAHDNELLDLIPVLEDLAGPQVADVSLVLDVAL